VAWALETPMGQEVFVSGAVLTVAHGQD
jgi:hypothetical protein